MHIGKLRSHLQQNNSINTIFRHFKLEKYPKNRYSRQFHKLSQFMNHTNTAIINGLLIYILILLLAISFIIWLVKKIKIEGIRPLQSSDIFVTWNNTSIILLMQANELGFHVPQIIL